MSYCSQSDIETRIGPADLVALADHDGDGSADSAVVQGAITSAQALIDSYLSVRYAVPVAPVPDALKTRAVSLAVYFLRLGRDSVTDDVRASTATTSTGWRAPWPARWPSASSRVRPTPPARPACAARASRASSAATSHSNPRGADHEQLPDRRTPGAAGRTARRRRHQRAGAHVVRVRPGPGAAPRRGARPLPRPEPCAGRGCAARGGQCRARGAAGAARRGGHGRPGRRRLRGAGGAGDGLRRGPANSGATTWACAEPTAWPGLRVRSRPRWTVRPRRQTPPGPSGPPPSRSRLLLWRRL